jgi:hypothetical protein
MKRLIPFAILTLVLLAAPAPASAHYYGPHPHFYGSVSFGYPSAYGYGSYPVDDDGRPLGAIDLDVSPEETKVWVDGQLAGTCDDFDGYPQWLFLRPGTHQIKLVTPKGHVHQETVKIKAGMKLNYDLDMGK